MKRIFTTLVAIVFAIPLSFAQYLPLTAGSGVPLTGDLYIQKTNPSIKLIDAAGGNSKLTFQNSNELWSTGFATNNADYSIKSDATGDTWLLIKSITGKVGIGTTSPTYKLSIVSTETAANSQAAFFQAADGGYSALAFTGDNSASVGSMTTYNGYVLYGSQNTTHTGTNGEIGINTSNHDVIIGGAAVGVVFGNVGIGTTIPDQKLTVNGTIHSTEVKVDLSVPGPDYVFKPNYKLTGLSALKTYIDKNHHLPEIPTAGQMDKDGINLGDMNVKLLKKVEELTLYVIEKDKQLQQQSQRLKKLEDRLDAITTPKTQKPLKTSTGQPLKK